MSQLSKHGHASSTIPARPSHQVHGLEQHVSAVRVGNQVNAGGRVSAGDGANELRQLAARKEGEREGGWQEVYGQQGWHVDHQMIVQQHPAAHAKVND